MSYSFKRSCSAHTILYHLLDIFIIVGRMCFMPRAEIENLTVAALDSTGTSEHLSALKPAEHDQFIRDRNIKMLPVHLLFRQLKVLAQTGCNRMRRVHNPEPLPLICFTPLQVA